MKNNNMNLNRHRDFIKVYGREPSEEELRTFTEYIELVKTARSQY